MGVFFANQFKLVQVKTEKKVLIVSYYQRDQSYVDREAQLYHQESVSCCFLALSSTTFSKSSY